MKIIHIINSLKKGGAEGNLFRLCEFQKKKYKNKIDITIITLIDNGFYESDLKKMGIRVFSLKINLQRKFFDFIYKIIELRKFIKKKIPISFKVGCTIQILLLYSFQNFFIINFFGILDILN